MFPLGLVGFPLGHSVSPFIHTAFLKQAGFSGFYRLLETPPTVLETTVEDLKKQGFRGWNVTIPHKTAMLPYLDGLDDNARAMGAVNTVVHTLETGKTKGFNTDSEGFWRSLPTTLQNKLPQTPACVIGAGGSSRAVVMALALHGCPAITIAARSPNKAEPLLAMARQAGFTGALDAVALEDAEALHTTLNLTQLVVNTTPIGMWPELDATPLGLEALLCLPKQATVIDLIYKPLQTQLLYCAEGLGLHTQNGLGMLVHQAALAFELWTRHTLSAAQCVSVYEALLIEMLQDQAK